MPTSCWSSCSSPRRPARKVDDLSGGMKRRLDDRPVADQPARDAAARRADHRPRPAGPARRVGPAVPAQAAGRDAGAHDPLHGRGRAAVRPARRHGQGPDRRRGLAARADPEHSTREVAELRFGVGRARGDRAARSRTSPSGSRCCPTGSCSTPTTARRRWPRCTSAGCDPVDVAGAPLHAGGRLPAPHRPDAGRLMSQASSVAATAPVRSTAPRQAVDYWAIVYRRTWKGTVFTSFLEPLLYVLAMGVLLGGFIEGDPAQLDGAPRPTSPSSRPGLLARPGDADGLRRGRPTR